MTSEPITTPEASLSLGDAYYVDEAYELAIDTYATALTLTPDTTSVLGFRALAHRAAALFHQTRYSESSVDSQTALALLPLEGLRKGETEVVYRRLGLACWELKRLDEARSAFAQAAQLAALNGADASRYDSWIQQCTQSKSEASTKNSPERKISVPQTTSTSSSSTPSSSRPTMPKYQYYQNDNVMTIAILESNVQEEDLQVTFQLQRLSVRMKKGGVDFTIIHGILYNTIDVDRCHIKFLSTKVLLKLRKQDAHEWHDLFGKEEKDTSAATATAAAAPKEVPEIDRAKARPYASHRDWDAIGRDLKQQEETEVPEGDEAVNKLFQTIYKDADEDTRRAMIKSFQTSGGTVLSTNWDEVQKKNYEEERQAPKGMEWKNWEGEKLPQQED